MKNKNEQKELWNINEEDFPTDANLFELWEFLLNYAVLAPSSRNSQPWQFHIGGDFVALY